MIKDDVRREEMRIFREWQQHEKKNAIVEKQVAAEIRKLKMAQSQIQKVAHNEERVRAAKGRKERAEGKRPDPNNAANRGQKKRAPRKSKQKMSKSAGKKQNASKNQLSGHVGKCWVIFKDLEIFSKMLEILVKMLVMSLVRS